MAAETALAQALRESLAPKDYSTPAVIGRALDTRTPTPPLSVGERESQIITDRVYPLSKALRER